MAENFAAGIVKLGDEASFEDETVEAGQELDSYDAEGREIAFNTEMEAMAATIENLAEDIPAEVLGDLTELSQQVYEGMVTMKEAHAKLRAKTSNRAYRTQSAHPSASSSGSVLKRPDKSAHQVAKDKDIQKKVRGPQSERSHRPESTLNCPWKRSRRAATVQAASPIEDATRKQQEEEDNVIT